ncbi:MAG: AI-2E family transporter [Acidobacteriaceae bacterium]|nr:AI-2E family transporter [Acidobacteriaceae bacterium]
MLGIDERTLRVLWTVFLFSMLLAIIYFVRATLLVFALAIFFAYMIWPIVGFFERFLPKRRRNYALAMVYTLLVGLLILLGFELIPTIASQATAAITRIPQLLSTNRLAQIPLPEWLATSRTQILSILTTAAADLRSRMIPFIQQASTHILSGLGALLAVILIPILAFFFLKDGEAIRVNLIGAVDSRRGRTLMQEILDDIHFVLRSYIRALLLLALSSFLAWIIFLSIMRYPYEVLMAVIAGVLEFIPAVGPASALVIMLLIAGASGSGSLVWIVIFWGIYRLFADYVLSPYIFSAGVELHPLLILFGVLAGERLAGVPGMFFSIPAIAILRVLYVDLRKAYMQKQLATGVPAAPAKIVSGAEVEHGANVETRT